MFKALKDNKITAISDTDSTFPCFNCDAIASDPEHTTSDYVEVNGEYVLVTDDKAIERRKKMFVLFVIATLRNTLTQSNSFLFGKAYL